MYVLASLKRLSVRIDECGKTIPLAFSGLLLRIREMDETAKHFYERTPFPSSGAAESRRVTTWLQIARIGPVHVAARHRPLFFFRVTVRENAHARDYR